MTAVTRRLIAATTLLLTAFSPVVLEVPSASGFPKDHSVIGFDYNITATSTIKKANQTIVIGGGKFEGEVDFDTARIEGSIKLPPVQFTMKQQGIGLVTATAAMVSTKKVTGKVNLNNFKVTATSTFNMKLLSMYVADPTPPKLPLPLPFPLPPLPTLPPLPKVNLVGNNCTTASPITVTMSGIAKIGGVSKFKGIYDIPKFKTCSIMTAALNQLVPGPGNTFAATARPAE